MSRSGATPERIGRADTARITSGSADRTTSPLLPPAYRVLLIGGAGCGFVATTWLLLRADLGEARELIGRVVQPASVALLVGATLVNLGLRFVRWQYLLRRAGVRSPTRESALVFLASLGLGFVPLCAGEIAFKGALLGRAGPGAARRASTVAVYERVCDIAALSAVAALLPLLAPGVGSAPHWLWALPAVLFAWPPGRRAALAAAGVAVALVARLLRAGIGTQPDPAVRTLARGSHSLVAFVLGLLAWGSLCAATAFVARPLFESGESWAAAPLFARSTLLGGASLAPGGMGVTGVVFDRALVRMGAESGGAFVLVLVVRASTFWLALALGQLALLRAALVSRPTDHFEALSAEYDAQIPAHVRELLVERKTRKILERMGDVRGRRGLDIGCGLGWYMARLREKGARVVGLDLSAAQIRRARAGGSPVVRASAVELPFASEAFDFAYSVNVIHHLPSRELQQQALAEAARVLKPGGILFIHEINVRNSLFRFYMSYVFPLLKRIDEGVELWLDPEHTPIPSSLRRDSVAYFTFVPDFVPRPLLRLALPLEARLERSPLAPYSAHFVLALQKLPASYPRA